MDSGWTAVYPFVGAEIPRTLRYSIVLDDHEYDDECDACDPLAQRNHAEICRRRDLVYGWHVVDVIHM